MKVKNIIFDFGGVLLNLDYQKTFDALSQLLGLQLAMENLPDNISKLYLEFERGDITRGKFLEQISEASNHKDISTVDIINAWNAMLLGWNPDRLPWLLRLRKTYNTYLLSNTNEIHIEWALNDLKVHHDVTNFETSYFDNICYSHIARLQKPDARIYHKVVDQNNLDLSETIFIDDSMPNIKGAQDMGLHAIYHDPTLEIMDMLPQYIANASL